jgi:ribosome biogenesis GTPase
MIQLNQPVEMQIVAQQSNMIGQIICNISDTYRVKYNDNYIDCKARGKFRNNQLKPLVGDKVIFDQNKKIINELLPRKNELLRPPVCNVDQALIVISAKEPDLDLYLLDKLISIITYNNIDIAICFTKIDLLIDEEKKIIDDVINYYLKIGYKAFKNSNKNELIDTLKNKVTVLTGQSGVGKSSLINCLDSNLNLKTNEISLALGRGKHTTRHVELLEINGALIADTPGFSSIDFKNMSKIDIRDSMIEFAENLEKCKYRDCLHIKEDNCMIKELVNNGNILESRYNNYKKFIQEKEEDYDKNIRFHSVKK